jgi:hypothetical protein
MVAGVAWSMGSWLEAGSARQPKKLNPPLMHAPEHLSTQPMIPAIRGHPALGV